MEEYQLFPAGLINLLVMAYKHGRIHRLPPGFLFSCAAYIGSRYPSIAHSIR